MKTHNQNHTPLGGGGGGVQPNMNPELNSHRQHPAESPCTNYHRAKLFLITLIFIFFALISCGVKETTGTGGGGAIDYGYDVSFALAGTTNFSAITGTSATYTYASNELITLTAIKTNFTGSTNTNNFFRYTVTPANVISISTNTTTNSITFELTNMAAGSVKITAIATNASGHTNGEFSYTINLRKANYPTPPIVYITTNQTNIAGFVLTYAVLSDNRTAFSSTTAFNRISGNATAGISTSGTVTVTNGTDTSTFEVKLTSPNYVDYMVHIQSVVPPSNNNGLQTIIESGNLAGLVDNTDPLVTNTLAHLTDSANFTANTTIIAIYATEIGTGNQSGSSWANSIAATNLRNMIARITDATASKVYAVLVAGGTYKPTYDGDRNISFVMKNHVAVIGGFATTGSWELTGTTTFSGNIGDEAVNTDNTYHVFDHNAVTLDNALLYGVTVTGGNANGNFRSFNNGGGMFNRNSSPRLFNVVFTGNNASRGGGGMYNISGSSPRLFNVMFSGNSTTPDTTLLSGGGGMHNDTSSPVLTSVMFSNNTTVQDGGGMFNFRSSPVLTNVVFNGNSSSVTSGGMCNVSGSSPRLFNVAFSNNTSAGNAGGMYNDTSSPVLTDVVFSGNSARLFTGGMLNFRSSPVLTSVVFKANSALNGGGMYNNLSTPVLIGVVFNGNSATQRGGGMYNNNLSSPVLIGVVFTSNSAIQRGGGMYNNNDANPGPLIVNGIFEGNTAPTGQDIAMYLDTPGGENIRIAGSVLGIGVNNPTNAIVIVGVGSIDITYHSLANGAVNFGANATTGDITYPTILGTSSAKDLGLFVRRSGTDYYFSEDKATWYTNFTATGGFGVAVNNLPAGAENLTARDIAGNSRVGRPDAGVYEYRP